MGSFNKMYPAITTSPLSLVALERLISTQWVNIANNACNAWLLINGPGEEPPEHILTRTPKMKIDLESIEVIVGEM